VHHRSESAEITQTIRRSGKRHAGPSFIVEVAEKAIFVSIFVILQLVGAASSAARDDVQTEDTGLQVYRSIEPHKLLIARLDITLAASKLVSNYHETAHPPSIAIYSPRSSRPLDAPSNFAPSFSLLRSYFCFRTHVK
jgi:hypothetical protein